MTRVNLPATSFDFLLGEWRVTNRRVASLLSEHDDWIVFASTVSARRILGSGGVLDRYTFPDFPGRGQFHGVCLRLAHVPTDRWSVWWSSSGSRGRLDPPVVGGFVHGEGVFHGEDMYGGRPVLVRTRYYEITETSFRWRQEFSFDGGEAYCPDWIMEFERTS
jgi:hypothetical protein